MPEICYLLSCSICVCVCFLQVADIPSIDNRCYDSEDENMGRRKHHYHHHHHHYSLKNPLQPKTSAYSKGDIKEQVRFCIYTYSYIVQFLFSSYNIQSKKKIIQINFCFFRAIYFVEFLDVLLLSGAIWEYFSSFRLQLFSFYSWKICLQGR